MALYGCQCQTYCNKFRVFILILFIAVFGYFVTLRGVKTYFTIISSQRSENSSKIVDKYSTHKADDYDSCLKLLSEGIIQKNDEWKPTTCNLHIYSKNDSQACIKRAFDRKEVRHVVFLGDSRVRQLYYEFVSFLSKDEVKREAVHHSLQFLYENTSLLVEFLWHTHVHTMQSVYESWINSSTEKRPNIVFTSCATWYIKESYGNQRAVIKYRDHLKTIRPLMENLMRTVTVLWMLQEPVAGPGHMHRDYVSINNKNIDLYNVAVKETLNSSYIWSTPRLIGQHYLTHTTDGLHSPPRAQYWVVELIYNMLCNNRMQLSDTQRTCCI